MGISVERCTSAVEGKMIGCRTFGNDCVENGAESQIGFRFGSFITERMIRCMRQK